VTPEVGVLVPETDDRQALAQSLAAAVTKAVDDDWKHTMGPTAEAYATENFSVVGQVARLIHQVEQITGTSLLP
jgi:hypothetical protein